MDVYLSVQINVPAFTSETESQGCKVLNWREMMCVRAE